MIYSIDLKAKLQYSLSLVILMPSETKETQLIQAMNTVAEFVKILVKEYPLVFNTCAACDYCAFKCWQLVHSSYEQNAEKSY